MPALANIKHEKFCQAMYRGEHAGNATACYCAIYNKDPKDPASRSYASRLNQRDDISQRIAELQQQSAAIESKAEAVLVEKTVATKEWVRERLVENVKRAMQVTAVLDSEGHETGEFKYDGNVANRALELLGKELGMFVERRALTVEYADKSDDQLKQHAAALVAELGKYGLTPELIAGIGIGNGGATAPTRPH